jgi:hypothetical protein
VWDGIATWVSAPVSLAGCDLTFTFYEGCSLDYNNGLLSVGATCAGGCVTTCEPTFSVGTFRIQSGVIGAPCSFGNITGVVSE